MVVTDGAKRFCVNYMLKIKDTRKYCIFKDIFKSILFEALTIFLDIDTKKSTIIF